MSKIPGIKRPATKPVSAVTPSGAEAHATKSTAITHPDVEDPIEYSLQIREAQGGLNSQVTEAIANSKKLKIFRAAKHPATRGPASLDFTGGDSSAASAASQSKLARPTAVGSQSKLTAAKRTSNVAKLSAGSTRSVTSKAAAAASDAGQETDITLNEDLKDANDPIALSLQDRLKAGGLTTVIKEMDAKKSGIKLPKLSKHTAKASAQVQDFVGGSCDSGRFGPICGRP